MALDSLRTLNVIEVMENFIEHRRPPKNIRDKLDLSYKIEGQSIIIFEIRPRFNQPTEKMECFVAKATFVNTKNIWKVFWMPSDLKWHSYTPKQTVKTIEKFCELVDNDNCRCFFG